MWLDPLIYADIVDRISSALGGIDPARAESIAERSATLQDRSSSRSTTSSAWAWRTVGHV